MEEAERTRVEHEVRSLHEAHDFARAATVSLRAYGGEIYGFLVGVHRDETLADEAFSAFTEALWRSLPGFAWRSSLRTWAYAVARSADRVQRRDAARRNRRLASESALDEIAAAVRTETLEYLKTEKRGRLQALRDALSPEDRALLIMRVDRKLSWNELAIVLSDDGALVSDADLPREAARLRKRFQLLKEHLRQLAKTGNQEA